MVHRVQPAPGDLISQRVVAVLLEPLDRHPLERRPAVRLIPLLPGFIFGGENTARREQTGFNGIGQPFSLLMRRHAHIQRHNAGRREQRQGFTPPVVITITAVLFVPQIAVHRRAPVAGFLAEQISRLFIPFRRGDIGDSALQFEQECVQINGDKLCRADAGQPRRIAQPAG